MTSEVFAAYLEEMQGETVETLKNKAKEYATGGDRLHNFRVAAAFQGITEEQALMGMAAKHLVSIRDMVFDGQKHTIPLWEEKIKDSINCLFLLWAMVCEKADAAELTN